MIKTNIICLFFALLLLSGCDNSDPAESGQQARDLAKRSLDNMVVVEGGEFLMGDFGPLVGEKLPFSINRDDKQLHKVILSDFMISKYKVTNKDFNEYLNITRKDKLPPGLGEDFPLLLEDDVSASVPWETAKDYCLWLGKMSGKKVDLPTEAQWEYAARSRGQYFPFATDDGTLSKGRNIPTHEEIVKMNGWGLPFYPIGKYPPNPLGLYDMGLSGAEWTNDWYAADYYSYSPLKDPQGPEQGAKKVLRGNIGGDNQLALTMFRQSRPPIPRHSENDDYKKYGIGPAFVFRCVVNH